MFHIYQHTDIHTPCGLPRYRDKLVFSKLNPFSVFLVMPKGERSFVKAQIVVETISNFWASTDPNICPLTLIKLRNR